MTVGATFLNLERFAATSSTLQDLFHKVAQARRGGYVKVRTLPETREYFTLYRSRSRLLYHLMYNIFRRAEVSWRVRL